jgi:hypothetical protein
MEQCDNRHEAAVPTAEQRHLRGLRIQSSALQNRSSKVRGWG